MKKRNYKLYCLLILLGILVIFYDKIEKKHIEQQNDKKITSFFEQIPIEEKIVEEKQPSKPEYIAILEIPAISLKRGLVATDSPFNSIQYNIAIMIPSNMPEVEKGNLILASHNGTSSVSFFRNLYQLKEGDILYIYNRKYRYTYQFNYKYEVEKTGKVEIIRDDNQTTLTLITCKKGSKTKQEVYISYLIDKQTYP